MPVLNLWVWALFAGALLLLFWVVGAYARLNQLRTAATQARALVDPLQQQRAGLIRRRTAHRDTDPVPGASEAHAGAGEPAGSGAGSGDAVPAALTDELASTEARLALLGQAYNDLADAFNNAISEWPTLWLARLMGMKEMAPWADPALPASDPAARDEEGASNGG